MEDLYDITKVVRRVRILLPELPDLMPPLDSFTNDRSYYLDADQVAQLAAVVGPGRLSVRDGSGWQETVPGKGVRVLAERHIAGQTYYRLRKHWNAIEVGTRQ